MGENLEPEVVIKKKPNTFVKILQTVFVKDIGLKGLALGIAFLCWLGINLLA